MPKKKIEIKGSGAQKAVRAGARVGMGVVEGARFFESPQNKAVIGIRKNQKKLIDAVKEFPRNRRQKDF